MEFNRTYQGNALNILKTFPDNYIDCCITSPPYYQLRNYQTEPQIWDGDINCKHLWKENICEHCNAWRGELGLEPTKELYIKHLLKIFAEVKRVLKKEGVLFVNIGDTSGSLTKIKGFEKSMLQIPHRFSIAMTDDLGYKLRRDIIWHKPSIMPMSVKDNFTLDYENIFFFVKQNKYYFEQQFETANYDGRKDTIFKGSNKYKDEEIIPNGKTNSMAGQKHERWKEIDGKKVRNMRSVWSIISEPLSEAHFASYPQKLVERMIRAGCPEGGIVLDPFIGSGTTGIVARKLNRNYIGIDVAYHDVNEKRYNKELGLFA